MIIINAIIVLFWNDILSCYNLLFLVLYIFIFILLRIVFFVSKSTHSCCDVSFCRRIYTTQKTLQEKRFEFLFVLT